MGLTYQMKMKIPFDMADMNGHIKLPDVILLSFFMDMNDAEIAREMKIVRSTVHEHRKRSLEVLKNIMEMLKNEKKE